MRFSKHKYDYKTHKNTPNRFISSYEILQYESAKIVLIEDYPCDNKDQLNSREQYWISENKAICVNRNKATSGISTKDLVEWKRNYDKQYAAENAEKIKEYRKKYYEENKEKLYMKQNETKIKNAEKIKLQQAQYRKDNYEALQEYKRQYRLKNKEILNQKQKEYIQKKKG